MYESGSHAGYSGLEVLRDLGRYRGEPVLAPVVFTSALDLGELFADNVVETFGEPVWIISQGPQVLLDAQVTELRGGLLLNWDVRESAFPQRRDRCHVRQVYRGGRTPRRRRSPAGTPRPRCGCRAPRPRCVPRSTRPTVRSAGGVCIRASSSMPRPTRSARGGVGRGRRGGRVELPGTRAALACRRGGAARARRAARRRGRRSVAQGAGSDPGRARGACRRAGRMCRSDSTSRMRGAPRSSRPPMPLRR